MYTESVLTQIETALGERHPLGPKALLHQRIDFICHKIKVLNEKVERLNNQVSELDAIIDELEPI